MARDSAARDSARSALLTKASRWYLVSCTKPVRPDPPGRTRPPRAPFARQARSKLPATTRHVRSAPAAPSARPPPPRAMAPVLTARSATSRQARAKSAGRARPACVCSVVARMPASARAAPQGNSFCRTRRRPARIVPPDLGARVASNLHAAASTCSARPTVRTQPLSLLGITPCLQMRRKSTARGKTRARRASAAQRECNKLARLAACARSLPYKHASSTLVGRRSW